MSREGLGECRTIYTARWSRVAVLFGTGAACFLVLTAAYLLGHLPWPAYLLAVAVNHGLWMLQIVRLGAVAIQVYENGLVIQGIGGETAFLWRDLLAVYVAVQPRLVPLAGETPLARAFRIEGGERMAEVRDDVEGFDILLTRVANEVNTNVAAEILGRFDGGKTVEFGPIRLDLRHGLMLGEETWAWGEVGSLACRGGALVFASGERCPLGLVPNPHLFLRLVEQQGVDGSPMRDAIAGRAG